MWSRRNAASAVRMSTSLFEMNCAGAPTCSDASEDESSRKLICGVRCQRARSAPDARSTTGAFSISAAGTSRQR
jgi:hypothetical protein